MSPTATLQRKQQGDIRSLIEQEVRKLPNSTCGLLYLYCAGNLPDLEGHVNRFLQTLSGVNSEIRKDETTQTLAVLFPGLALDAAHYQSLLLKQHLLDIKPDADPKMTLTSVSQVPSSQMLKTLAESARLSVTTDIQIFTDDQAENASRILIVDHDESVREFLQIRLAMQGYETLEAVDGLEALKMIPMWEPDLVLTEINLYGIDGLPFIHHIHQLDVKAPPKIVVLSEKRVEQTISQCFQNGVDDYVTKPFSPVELDARIRRCLH
ncbi:response regulator transcription factor [Paenibacillus lemnae]|uniref:Response regulator n=1 Tax=Paenibacillus lemnae TaxID=1330551 RepID=A0A848M2V4_PAELE|nr:response regulator transcription factor [Paenibacillus lemnae]NMO94581.1 response regulator [Paenibacillus lemnae]